MKFIICDPIAPSAIAAMREAGIEVDVRDDITPEGLETIIADYDGMVVRSRTKVREPLIDKATNLKVIIRGGVGLDNIDVKYAESKGIEVRNTPSASSNSVAELTIGYLLALARQLPQVTASMKDGKWEKKVFSKGSELAGKTLGLIGLGRIGSLMAQKANALGMKVLFYRRTPTEVDYATQVSLDDLLARSDYVSLHVPHTPETHYIVGAEAIAKMKDGVKIVNCGRGGTLDEAALYDAVANGKVAGAALDVYEDEKGERGKRFMDLPQVIGSPHIGAGTMEAKARVGAEVAQIAIEVTNR
ncbi:MAG: 3-phosphoglycerate dehydrogenase [Chloroflexi bacterium]|nr:MAG: 3-phosphoglycerate dehydrogenase [Anaerolineaceae bacterium 4572_32.2]RLC79557.1 MAG: 3-phosphoglycerate dehydrogenase [Chloroflexota bacterium]RLC86765.1 MAG: 3-phosphoglycerate dehydrogenase [Chloroflexota bacterium]HEY73888.1 3-phosphoglycerate dehydrogenase [Thermoflexia bacterium]